MTSDRTVSDNTAESPRIIQRAEHNISRANISENALKVLYRLDRAGDAGYLVGGGVRDLLLGREPKDFDIATDARPEQVRELFRNCRIIGRRFRLAHVHFGQEIIEVATFRAQHDEDAGGDGLTRDGRIVRDNVYGEINGDAWRRDFTVNALYYNIADFSVEDYVGGLEDIRAGRIRLIGNPCERYREDPVRMLRAVRFAVKLGFKIDAEAEQPLFELADLLGEIPPARLFEEVLKLLLAGCALQTFEALRHYGLFRYLFPEVEASLAEEEGGFPRMLLIRALENTDLRIAEGRSVTPTFLFAALLWCPLLRAMQRHLAARESPLDALLLGEDAVIARQIARVALPRRITLGMREIWEMQIRLARLNPRRAAKTMQHPRFRAAYDFLLLRAAAGEPVQEMAGWWTAFQETEEGRNVVVDHPQVLPPRRRRPRNRDGGGGGRHGGGGCHGGGRE